VTLYLDQRDRGPGEPPVPERDGVVAVLPTLVHQTAVRGPLVLHEAVAVAVAVCSTHSSARSTAGTSSRSCSTGTPQCSARPTSITNSGVESMEP
jgi:hypothetical protein